MARTKGMLNLSGNLEVNAGAPLDARTVVPTVADLTVASNFQYKYVGMPVVVQATGDMYILTANDVTVAANWKQIGSGGGGSSYTAGDGIVIDDDEISTDNMPAADMSEIIDPLPSIPTRYQKYSTDEQVVGEWIDGKPIYQKTIVGNTNNDIPFSSISSNIEEIVDLKFRCGWYYDREDCYYFNTNYKNSDNNYRICVSITNKLISSMPGTYCKNKELIVTVWYTKTTD